MAGYCGAGGEMGHHALSMDASVCSTGSVDGDRFLGHSTQAGLYLALNGPVVELPLPATKVSAVVTDKQFDVSRLMSHLLLNRKNALIQDGHNLFYGKVGTVASPMVSSKPSIRFIFCTACPEAPLTILSMADIIIILLVTGSIL